MKNLKLTHLALTTTSTATLVATTLALSLSACKATSPALTGPPRKVAPVSFAATKPDPKVFEGAFGFSTSEFTDTQARYDENQISVLFQVNKDGKSVNGLTGKDLKVEENGVDVPKFELAANTERKDQVVDIAFVVDITGSMGPFIESAKLRLKNFIVTSHKKGYHVRMCLSTFGDMVVKHCDRFYDNQSDQQRSEFISDLSQLTIHRGQGEDPKILDWEENPMRALYDAAGTSWADGSQRFTILVTDADFYSPDKPNKHIAEHQANPETAAPTMSQVNQSVKNAGIKVFAVTPPATGYNAPLAGEGGVVQASGGEFFEFKQVVDGRISLDTILDRILLNIKTTYKLTYTVDKTPGLDATLPLEQRKIVISTAAGTTENVVPSSSIATGRPNYKQTWKVSDQNIQAGSTQVFVNDKIVDAQEYNATGTDVTFKSTPEPGAKIRVVFLYEALDKNLRREPMPIPGRADAQSTKVYLNGKPARAEDIQFASTLEGGTNLSLADSVFASSDPYELKQNGGVRIRVVTNYTK